MAQRTTSLRQPSAIRGAGRGMHLLEMITAVAILAALLAVGARVTGRLPSERAAPLTGTPTRLLQMGGIWVNTAINPQRERIFRVLDPATGAETGETLPFHLPENGPPPTFSGDGHILAYTDTSPSYVQPVISIMDAATGDLRRSLAFDQPTFAMRLNADGTRLMLYQFSTPSHPPFILLTVDVATGAMISTVTLSSSSDEWPIITPDLRTAYVLDTHNSGTWPNVTSGDVSLDMIDTATGARQVVPLPLVHAGVFPENRMIRDEPVIRSFAPALIPSPDSARLYIVHADADAITVINRKEARVERHESIHPATSAAHALFGWFAPEQVAAKEEPESMSKWAAVAPDGRTLAVTGVQTHPRDDGMFDNTNWGVQFVDLTTFTETAHLLQGQDQGYLRSFDVQWSADSTLVYLGNITNPVSGAGDDPYQLRVIETRTYAIVATQTYLADTDTPGFLRETWFALAK